MVETVAMTIKAYSGRLLPSTTPQFKEMPKGIIQAAVLGFVAGPLLGVFFGWSGPIRAAAVSAIYAVVFYTTYAVPTGYARRHSSSRLAVLLTGLAGIIVASVVMFMIFQPTLGMPIVQIVIVLGLCVLAWAHLVSRQQVAEVEKGLATSRAHTKMLRSNMNPHFFFNTLNTISALIPEDGPTAQRMLGLMADMSRYAFSAEDVEVVELEHELGFARAYVQIEQVRFRERLRCELPTDASIQGLHIPIFTLQPLIENAVRHGIAKRIGGGTVRMILDRNAMDFSVTVENDADSGDVSESKFFQPGHALHNIRERLRLIYAGRASVEVRSPRENVVAVTIQAPVVVMMSRDPMRHS